MAFQPALLKVYATSNYLSPGDTLWITAEWQNQGDTSLQQPLRAFLDLEFGHQRMPETGERFHRKVWVPLPGLHTWKPGDVVATTCRWRVPNLWGGSYRLSLGFCDENQTPVSILGPAGQPVTRVYIGDIELGWGWGIALVEKIRKPWNQVFQAPLTTIHEKTQGQLPHAAALKLPEPVSIQIEISFRDTAADEVLYSYSPGVDLEFSHYPDGEIRGSVRYKDSPVAEFSLLVETSANQVHIGLRETWETTGYELLEIRLPALLSMEGEDVSIIDFFGGGRLISLKDALPMGYVHPYDTHNAAALLNSQQMWALVSSHLDDQLRVAVVEVNGHKRAILGVNLVTRLRGHGTVQSVETPDTHHVELTRFMGKPDWLMFAKYLRQDLKASPYHSLYRRALYYVYYATQGPQPEPWQVKEDSPYPITRLNKGLKFPQILEQVKKYSFLFDGQCQIAWIYGYNKQNDEDGSNLSFPYAEETDPRAGTIEELRQTIEEAEKYQAYIGLYENYDDLYVSNKCQDLSIAAHDAYGQPLRGWIWADGPSYIIGSRKYEQRGLARERVKRMFERYGPRKVSYIDVLSSEVLRTDFDPECPASAETSLKSRLNLIREFNQYGTDVSSETLVHPYVGRCGYFYHTRIQNHDSLFFGEKYIPLIAAIYHGVVGYSARGGSRKEMLLGLLDGGNYGFEIDAIDDETCVKWVYLHNLPLGQLYDEQMEAYHEEQGEITIQYSHDSHIKIDLEGYRYEVVANGQLVGKDWTTFAPGFRAGTYLAFSLAGGRMRYPIPPGWEGAAIRAVTLTSHGEGESVPCFLKDGCVEIHMPAETPVRVENKALGG